MKRICIDKRTGQPVNDFQDTAMPASLVSNAVRAGLGVAEDFEEVLVSDADFSAHVAAASAAGKEASDNELLKRKQKRTSLTAKLKAVGLDDEEISLLLKA